MKQHKWFIIIGMLFIFTTAVPGKAMAKDLEASKVLICQEVGFKNASGKPSSGENFEIELYGLCSLSTAIAENKYSFINNWVVTYRGTYNYETKKASETIIHESKMIFKHNIRCSTNPWVHSPSCDKSTTEYVHRVPPLVIKPYAYDGTNIPISAYILGGEIRTALMEWETTQSNEELVADWDSLDDSTGGPPALTVKKPLEKQPININDDYLFIVLEVNPGFEPSNYLLEMERLEKAPEVSGDIAMPEDKTHIWQPTASVMMPWSMPAPIATKTSALIGGELASYRLRVRGEKGGYTPWRHFQLLDKRKFVPSGTLTLQSNQGDKQEEEFTQKKAGRGFVPQTEKKTKLGKAPFGMEKAGKSIRSSVAQMPKSEIVIEKLTWNATKPANTITLNILFKNKGKTKNSPGAEFKVQCAVKDGGPTCPVPNNNFKLNKVIGPGQTAGVPLIFSTPAKPGKYLVSVSIPPVAASVFTQKYSQTSTRSTKHVEINIAGMTAIKPGHVEAKPAVTSEPKEDVKSVVPLKKTIQKKKSMFLPVP